MGGEGHAFDMVNRMKENHRMLKYQHDRIREIRKMYLAHYAKHTTTSTEPPNLNNIKKPSVTKYGRKDKEPGFLPAVLCWLL